MGATNSNLPHLFVYLYHAWLHAIQNLNISRLRADFELQAAIHRTDRRKKWKIKAGGPSKGRYKSHNHLAPQI